MINLQSHLLIEASAGTGKTYTIEQIILELILSEKKQISQILAITFTEKAAWELKKRIRGKISEHRLKVSGEEFFHLQSALNDFDNAQIYTFHAFCLKTLKEFGLETGFCSGSPSSDMTPFIHELMRDFFRIHPLSPLSYESLISRFKNLEQIQTLILKLLNNGVTLQSLKNQIPVLLSPSYSEVSSTPDNPWKLFYDIMEFILLKLKDLKLEQGILFYDDMIGEIHQALVLHPDSLIHKALRSRFHYIIIDEFQDTDKTQWEIFQTLFMDSKSTSRLILVGDPKQSIYRFRNSDLNTYFKAKALIPSHHTLKTNYRSSPSMIKAFNTLFSLRPLFDGEVDLLVDPPQNKQNFPPSFQGKTLCPIHFWNLCHPLPLDDLRNKIALDVALRISEWMSSPRPLSLDSSPGGKLRWQDIAILCMRNEQCLLFQEILSKHHIPSMITDHKGLIASRETEDTLFLLRAVLNPEDKSDVKKALCTLYFNMSYKKLMSAEEEEFSSWRKIFYDFKQFSIQNGIPALLREILSRTKVIPACLLKMNGERTASNLKQLFQFLADLVLQNSFSLEALTEHLDHIRFNPPSIPLQIDRETDCVQIMTLHGSKGLQFPVVFLGSVFFQNRSPRQEGLCFFSDQEHTLIDLEYSQTSEIRHQEEKSEEYKRLLYVAMTRAQDLLYMPLYLPKQKNIISLPNFLWPEGKDFTELLSDLSFIPDLFEVEPLRDSKAISIPASFPSVSPLKTFENPFPDFSLSSHVVHHTSFSGLSAQDKDRDSSPAAPLNASSSLLPPGAKTGLLLHDLLEQMNFQWFRAPILFEESFVSAHNPELHELLCNKILLHDFPASCYPEILKILWNTLNTPLPSPEGDFRLCDVTEKQNEVEFLLPLESSIAEPVQISLSPGQKVHYVFETNARFLKGYIDLLFLHEGRYYIADWKSNDLGALPEDYQSGLVLNDLLRHRYPLQFVLYSAALYQFLKLQNLEHQTSSLFGGVYYLYLRGMDGISNRGVYYTRPIPEEINTVLKHVRINPHE